MKVAYLQEKDDAIIFTGNYMEIYIPMYYFEMGLAEVNGDIIDSMGMFNFRVNTSDKQDIETTKVHTISIPTMISLKPTSVVNREFELLKDSGKQKYKVLKFFNGDTVITSSNVVALVDNTEAFILKLLSEGKIPNTIDYEDVFKSFLKNLDLNNMNLNVHAMLIGMVVAELYRSKKDLSIPFRKVIGKGGNVSQTDYVAVNTRTLCSYSSTFSAVTFEDIDTMILTSVNRKRQNKTQAYTPVEAIVK